MTKPMYSTRPLKDGGYFDPIIVPDDFEAAYPITDTPIPEALKADGCVPKYRWETATWIDASEDAQDAKELQRDSDLSAAKQDAAEAKAENTALKETVTTVKGALKELMTYVSTLPAPENTATQGGAE